MKNIQDKIQNLNLDPILFSLVMNDEGHKWTMDKAKKVEKWYKRFLFLMHLYPEKSIVPDKDIDTFWHQHILDTQKYSADCQDIFGSYMHHFPYFGLKNDEDAKNLENSFSKTTSLYKKHFNEIPADELKSPSRCAQCTVDCSNISSHSLENMGFKEIESNRKVFSELLHAVH